MVIFFFISHLQFIKLWIIFSCKINKNTSLNSELRRLPTVARGKLQEKSHKRVEIS